ncbi:hypothetical protein [Streptomyces sp. NPDC000878]
MYDRRRPAARLPRATTTVTDREKPAHTADPADSAEQAAEILPR